jgi:hypothetical protein
MGVQKTGSVSFTHFDLLSNLDDWLQFFIGICQKDGQLWIIIKLR